MFCQLTHSWLFQEVSSERREYVTYRLVGAAYNSEQCYVRVLEDANLVDFALLTSSMHMAWLRHVGGRLEKPITVILLGWSITPFRSRRVSIVAVWTWQNWKPLAQAILDARANHPGATLADLYDPVTSCHRTCARHIKPLTGQWTEFTENQASLPSASAWNTYSCCMKRCVHR